MSAAAPSTPRRATAYYAPTTPQTGGGTPPVARVAASHGIQASPHYTTTRRHSLYGIEDRVVLDPGSRVWKVGFSGEGRPRDVLFAGGDDTLHPLWTLRRSTIPAEREEEERLLEARLKYKLRTIFHDSLLTDPKSRKVLLVEHPLLPLYVKEMLARILFNNLQVPSISFAPSSLLALLAVGRITGFVVDCGHLETTALPIFASRPLYPHLRTTPLAGDRLSQHLRALLLWFGTYLPPPTTLSGAINIPSTSRATRVPEEVLTDHVLETIKTRCLLVGEPLNARASSPDGVSPTLDVPPEAPPRSESDFSRLSADASDNSAFSVVSHMGTGGQQQSLSVADGRLEPLAALYTRHSTATDLHLRVIPPVSQQAGTGRGTLVIPGWIRERAAEVLFEGGDIDESSVVEIILESLLKVPIDLRKTLASTILVVGGTAALPGFIARLRAELVNVLSAPPPSPSTLSPTRNSGGRRSRIVPTYDKYATLRPLLPFVAILNNPSPAAIPPDLQAPVASGSPSPIVVGGKAPAFSPAMLPWVGGSLAGALKIAGTEIPRERWDEADPAQFEPDDLQFVIDMRGSSSGSVLPDWTRTTPPSSFHSAPVTQVVPVTTLHA